LVQQEDQIIHSNILQEQLSQVKSDNEVSQRSFHWNFGSVSTEQATPWISIPENPWSILKRQVDKQNSTNKARMDCYQSGFGPEVDIQHTRANYRAYEKGSTL